MFKLKNFFKKKEKEKEDIYASLHGCRPTLDLMTDKDKFGEIKLSERSNHTGVKCGFYVEKDYVNAEFECYFDEDKVFGTKTKGVPNKNVMFFTNFYPKDGDFEGYVVVADQTKVFKTHDPKALKFKYIKYEMSEEEKEFLFNMCSERAKENGFEDMYAIWADKFPEEVGKEPTDDKIIDIFGYAKNNEGSSLDYVL